MLKAVSNVELIVVILGLLVIQAIIIGIWGGISKPYSELVEKDSTDNQVISRCNWGEHGAAFLIVECVYLVYFHERLTFNDVRLFYYLLHWFYRDSLEAFLSEMPKI